ncbi:hypothetical protein CE91St65_14790 [[Clostridium] symbiosum]|nr:hypothetical protein CE91St65_14790 [[Clostridium] symbiosum]BDF28502.1 hypothetical protein CE91St66_14790 [[Clostridium] symbiosum]
MRRACWLSLRSVTCARRFAIDNSCPAQEVLWLIKKYVCANNREKTGDIPVFPYRYNGDIHSFMCIEILNVVE